MQKKRATPPTSPDVSPRDVIFATTSDTYRAHSDLLYLIHEISRMVSTHADQHLAGVGVTHSQWWAMMHIYEHEGLTQTELAARMQLGRASLGKLLERLEAKAWIERRPDELDSRVRRVFISAAAIPLFVHMTEEGRRLFKTFLNGLSSDEESVVLAGLRKIRANAERVEGL